MARNAKMSPARNDIRGRDDRDTLPQHPNQVAALLTTANRKYIVPSVNIRLFDLY
jgi:hypothetical protein